MRKRLLAIVAAMAMVMTMIPAVAFADTNVATVNGVGYSNLQDAIKAAAPAGTVEIVSDVTVDEWVMFAESLSIGTGQLITMKIDGLTINGNGHTLTVNNIESAGNGDRLFYDATNLNISNLTIEYDGGLAGGIGLKSGVIKNVNFVGGVYGIFPGNGEIKVENCTFATNADALYFEQERDNLTITGCTFNQPDGVNVVLLRGDVKFTNNIINSGRTVNVVSGSPVVEGNDFKDVRLKVYNEATADVINNKVSNLTFNDATAPVGSDFIGNTLSPEAETALTNMGKTNEPNAPTEPTIPPAGGDAGATTPTTPAAPTDKPADSPKTGDDFNAAIPMALAGLAAAAMAAVVLTRKRQGQK